MSVIQVQLLHQERSQTRALVERADARIKALNRRNLEEILFRTCYMTIIAMATVVILGYGGYQVFVGALSIGGLVAFYSYLARIFDPLNAAVEIYARLNRLSASGRRILEVIEAQPSVPEPSGAVRLSSPAKGEVKLQDVSFSYRNGEVVLHHLNLNIEPGEKIALVGPSGSGKSTMAKLIARLYDTGEGAVYVDGIDVRSLRLEDIRSNVCYLMQDAVLFDRTLKENLLLGKLSATREELNRAIAIADLERLLDRLPGGWDTPLGPQGNALSGGERQRVALARAVLQSPCLFLLDESTSAVDSPSERRIFANLCGRFRNETFVFISHRISALRWVDRIVVLDRGSILDQGTHEQLVRRGGLYSQLCAPAMQSESSQILCEPGARFCRPSFPTQTK